MIHGIGVDITRVARFQVTLDRFGNRFAERILGEAELEGFRIAVNPAVYLAKRFAAKEACAKALGTGFRGGLSLRHIAVTHTEHGQPGLTCSARAREMFADYDVQASHLTLSDEGDYVVAFVVLEK